jgi:hypothetical protein
VQVEQALLDVAAPGSASIDLASAAKLHAAESALDDEIRRLQHDINEASERAARSIEARPH